MLAVLALALLCVHSQAECRFPWGAHEWTESELQLWPFSVQQDWSLRLPRTLNAFSCNVVAQPGQALNVTATIVVPVWCKRDSEKVVFQCRGQIKFAWTLETWDAARPIVEWSRGFHRGICVLEWTARPKENGYDAETWLAMYSAYCTICSPLLFMPILGWIIFGFCALLPVIPLSIYYAAVGYSRLFVALSTDLYCRFSFTPQTSQRIAAFTSMASLVLILFAFQMLCDCCDRCDPRKARRLQD